MAMEDIFMEESSIDEDFSDHSDAFDQQFDALNDELSVPSRSSVPRRLFFEKENHVPNSQERVVQTTPSQPQDPGDIQKLILDEIKQANSHLDTFSERLGLLETRLKSVESNQLSLTPNSSTDGSAVKNKRKVPAKVAVSLCRPLYDMALPVNFHTPLLDAYNTENKDERTNLNIFLLYV